MPLTNEELLRAAYLGLLGREPDADGFVAHLQRLEADGGGPHDGGAGGAGGAAERAAGLLRAFVDSAEFRAGRNAASALSLVRPVPAGAVFRHVASLGTDCTASWTLKQMGLKRYSLPLDWLFSSMAMVLHCLRDDFADLMDVRQYRPVPVALRPSAAIGLCDHALFHERYGVQHVFNHVDPTGVAAHAALVRAVERFRRLLASPAPKLFVMVVRNVPVDSVAPMFRALASTLDGLTAAAALEVIVLRRPAGWPPAFGRATLDTVGAHRLTAFQPYGHMVAVTFDNPFDALFMQHMIAERAFDLAAAP